jgi:hypothetical protein
MLVVYLSVNLHGRDDEVLDAVPWDVLEIGAVALFA